ncbi:Fpg/Nei family DNA glycosylase [Nocardioides limicola]|uniref:Fpg/Nei family DNA glycosylase n=1 Tax=Nocardioides limicola TaxID=2803368 RepID=UPI00193C26F5|nr:Fpg/Nei family DNA glycosylase [Nocardioides sp. DJM-14]
MPEGHTLRRLALDLTDAFAGQPVRVSSPQGRFAAEAADLDGAVLESADSAGKHLFIEFAGERFVHVHLGLIGKFDVRTGVDVVPEPVGQVRLRISGGRPKSTRMGPKSTRMGPNSTRMGPNSTRMGPNSGYADLRGATRCDLVGPTRVTEVIAGLGPDPLRPDADPDRAWRRIAHSDRPIGDLLMDQAVIAGVGNVYRAEVLFRHRMHPLRPGRTLRRRQFDEIWADLVDLMAEGVRHNRIDTVRPEHTPEAMGRAPRQDDHGGEVYVYRRAGLPCHVCGAPVRTEPLAGRNSFWCPRCQRAFRSRALQ